MTPGGAELEFARKPKEIHMKKLLSAAALLSVMALAPPPATAQAFPQKMSFACSSLMVFCVYDQGGNLLGILQQANALNREINGKLYSADYDVNGLTTDLALFYALPNCTGTPMIQSGYLGSDGVTVVADAPPPRALFDGKSFWSGSALPMIASPTCNVCYGVVCNGNPEGVAMPYTANIGPYWPTYAWAAVIETPKLAGKSGITIK